MSYKGWLIIVILSVALIYGGIFFIRSSPPKIHKTNLDVYDIENEGIPMIADASFIELEKIEYVKRFRSGFGPDTSDNFENCSVMRNFFVPFDEFQVEKNVKIFSPINGTITIIWQIPVNRSGSWIVEVENILTVIGIQSPDYPAITFYIMTVDIRGMGLEPLQEVSSGQHIGYTNAYYPGTVLNKTGSSVNVLVNTPDGPKKYSYFDFLTDEVFEEYKNRGATFRDQFIISKKDRENNPLKCTYDQIKDVYWVWDKGNIPNWIYLGEEPGDFAIVTNII